MPRHDGVSIGSPHGTGPQHHHAEPCQVTLSSASERRSIIPLAAAAPGRRR